MESSKYFSTWIKYYNETFYLTHYLNEQFLILNIFKECKTLKELAEVIKNSDRRSGDAFYYKNICLINISSPYIGKSDTEGNNDHWAVIRDNEPCSAIFVKLALELHGENGVYIELLEAIESETIS